MLIYTWIYLYIAQPLVLVWLFSLVLTEVHDPYNLTCYTKGTRVLDHGYLGSHTLMLLFFCSYRGVWMYITGSEISKQPGFEIQWFLGGWIRDMLEMLGQSKFGNVGILRDSVGISPNGRWWWNVAWRIEVPMAFLVSCGSVIWKKAMIWCKNQRTRDFQEKILSKVNRRNSRCNIKLRSCGYIPCCLINSSW